MTAVDEPATNGKPGDDDGPSGVVYSRHDPRVLVAPARPGAPAEREGLLPDNIVVMSTENGKSVTHRFNYNDVMRGKNLQQNIELKPGDTVIVP